MNYFNKIILIFMLLSIHLMATVHENAENGSISKWTMPFTLRTGSSTTDRRHNIYVNRYLDRYGLSPVQGKVSNIYDSTLKSHVIKLEGDEYNTVYLIGMDIMRYYRSLTYAKGKGWDTPNTILSFKLKSSDGFLMDVWVRTTKGRLLIRYSDTDEDLGLEDADEKESFKFFGTKSKIINIALGGDSGDGLWHQQRRDLLKDIRKFIPKIDIYTVEGIEIRGNCYLDDIKTEKSITTGIGTISGKVWNDSDEDWEINNKEKGLKGIKVSLSDRNNKLISTTKTDKNGNYSFKNLKAKAYHVKVTLPKGYENSTPISNNSIEIGDSSWKKFDWKNINFGLLKKSPKRFTISGIIWNDINEDWEINSNEPTDTFAGASITVILYDEKGNELDRKRVKGQYKFLNMPIGEYTVTVKDTRLVTSKSIGLWLEKDRYNINFGVK